MVDPSLIFKLTVKLRPRGGASKLATFLQNVTSHFNQSYAISAILPAPLQRSRIQQFGCP